MSRGEAPATGITLRELLAGLALHGAIASGVEIVDPDKCVHGSVALADALLAALDGPPRSLCDVDGHRWEVVPGSRRVDPFSDMTLATKKCTVCGFDESFSLGVSRT